MDSTEELLSVFLRKTYPRILGIPFPGLAQYGAFPSLEVYLASVNPQDKECILRRLAAYQSRGGAERRARMIRRMVEFAGNAVPVRSVLDFGCGSGSLIRYLPRVFPATEIAWGVDVDTSASQRASIDGANFFRWSESLDDAALSSRQFDLVTCVFTLHHIRSLDQCDVLRSLLSLLNPQGILCVMEDSWCSAEHPQHTDTLDCRFDLLTESEVRQMFLRNDQLANAWVYRRDILMGLDQYRSLEEWCSLVASIGATIHSSQWHGFDIRRLHGVPCGCFAASRQAHQHGGAKESGGTPTHFTNATHPW